MARYVEDGSRHLENGLIPLEAIRHLTMVGDGQKDVALWEKREKKQAGRRNSPSKVGYQCTILNAPEPKK